MESREFYLNQLNETVTWFLENFEKPQQAAVEVYPGWTARDVLGHLTFWHESFARNVNALAQNQPPKPLKGRFIDLNQQGVEDKRQYTLEAVVAQFRAAHQIIQQNILDPRLVLIPYKVGSRAYSPEEHMHIVHEHIRTHGRDLQRAVFKQAR